MNRVLALASGKTCIRTEVVCAPFISTVNADASQLQLVCCRIFTTALLGRIPDHWSHWSLAGKGAGKSQEVGDRLSSQDDGHDSLVVTGSILAATAFQIGREAADIAPQYNHSLAMDRPFFCILCGSLHCCDDRRILLRNLAFQWMGFQRCRLVYTAEQFRLVWSSMRHACAYPTTSAR